MSTENQNFRSDSRDRLTALVETALLLAIAFVLGRIKLWQLPNGGSVHPASMLPLCLIGLRRGKKWGFLGCFAFGIIDFLFDGGLALNIWSILLDYLAAYAMLGVTGFFCGKRMLGIWVGMPLAVLARFVCHFVTGVTIWAEYMPAEWSHVWLYSAVYNGSFLVIELALMMVISFALKAFWPRLLNPKKV